MDKDDEYRKYAREAQDLADRTRNAGDKESWLRIAQGWMALIRKPKQTKQESFDADAQARGTGQDDSDSSH